MAMEPDREAVIDVVKRYGPDVHEDQPEQVAGRWVENGFDDPDEVEAWIRMGATPEDARSRAEAGERPEGLAQAEGRYGPDDASGRAAGTPRDVVKGSTHSRERPGDPTDGDLPESSSTAEQPS